jgi:hypothetical protein
MTARPINRAIYVTHAPMDVGEMRAYLYSCVRMGADINSFKVTFDGKDITAAFRRELMRLVL